VFELFERRRAMKHDLDLSKFSLEEIVSIEENEGEEETIDIQVESPNMFFVEGDIYTHNSALNAEIITMESISEAFNKCFVADFIFTLSRTIEDKNTNQGRIYIAKNRNGPDGIVFPVFMEPKNVKIKVLQPSGETVQEIEKQSSETKLKKIYKSFKNEKE
jgi:hypothetical protein